MINELTEWVEMNKYKIDILVSGIALATFLELSHIISRPKSICCSEPYESEVFGLVAFFILCICYLVIIPGTAIDYILNKIFGKDDELKESDYEEV